MATPAAPTAQVSPAATVAAVSKPAAIASASTLASPAVEVDGAPVPKQSRIAGEKRPSTDDDAGQGAGAKSSNAKRAGANAPETTVVASSGMAKAGRGAAAAVTPCNDEGHWGADGAWVYPDDRELMCSLCQAAFVFTGMEQAWFAKRSLYPPSRCAECLAAKKQKREAKQKSGASGAGRCFNCGVQGHGAAECPKPVAAAEARKACYVCGSVEHLSRNCPQSVKSAKPTGCFTCGSTAHLSRECPQRPPPVCHNCGKPGHALKTCPLPPRNGGVCFAFQAGQCFRKKCGFVHEP